MKTAAAAFALSLVVQGAALAGASKTKRVKRPTPSASVDAEGRAHLKKAKALAGHGNCEAAIPEYTQAFDALNDPDILLARAECRRRAGQTQEALVDYRAYLEESPDPPNRAAIKAKIAALEAPPIQDTSPLPAPETAPRPALETAPRPTPETAARPAAQASSRPADLGTLPPPLALEPPPLLLSPPVASAPPPLPARAAPPPSAPATTARPTPPALAPRPAPPARTAASTRHVPAPRSPSARRARPTPVALPVAIDTPETPSSEPVPSSLAVPEIAVQPVGVEPQWAGIPRHLWLWTALGVVIAAGAATAGYLYFRPADPTSPGTELGSYRF